VKNKYNPLALNIIGERIGIPLNCALFALLYFLFTEVVEDLGKGSAILSDVFFSAVGK
jgi:hypothetical protein